MAQIYYPHQAVPIELHLVIFIVAIIAIVISFIFIWYSQERRERQSKIKTDSETSERPTDTNPILTRTPIYNPKEKVISEVNIVSDTYETIEGKEVTKEKIVEIEGRKFRRKYTSADEYLGEVLIG